MRRQFIIKHVYMMCPHLQRRTFGPEKQPNAMQVVYSISIDQARLQDASGANFRVRVVGILIMIVIVKRTLPNGMIRYH